MRRELVKLRKERENSGPVEKMLARWKTWRRAGGRQLKEPRDDPALRSDMATATRQPRPKMCERSVRVESSIRSKSASSDADTS